MRKLLLSLAVVAVAATSCQKDVVDNNTPMENITIEESVSPYAVSEEEALARLDEFMSAFDNNNTRASQRQVRSIHSVKFNDIAPATRSNDINVENLLYIAEFENNQGSAILGADIRVNPVYAVLDGTTLTNDDFNNAINHQNMENIETTIAGLIAQAAFSDASTYGLLPDDDLRTDLVYDTTTITVMEEILPLVETKWGRGYPYNLLYSLIPEANNRYLVNSSTIAVAQLVNYIYDLWSVNSLYVVHNHDMSVIRQFTHNANITDINKINKLARYIYDIGLHVGSGGTTDVDNVINSDGIICLMRDLNLPKTSAAYQPLNKNSIHNLLLDDYPIVVFGFHTDEENSENSRIEVWLVDGWKTINTQLIRTTENFGVVISREVISSITKDYVHCNFGKDGLCDGYYEYGIFDTTSARFDELIEEESGDIQNRGELVFDNIYQF